MADRLPQGPGGQTNAAEPCRAGGAAGRHGVLPWTPKVVDRAYRFRC